VRHSQHYLAGVLNLPLVKGYFNAFGQLSKRLTTR